MDALRFYSPLWLFVAPLALAAVWWAFHPRKRAAAVFSSIADLKALPVTFAQRIRRALPYVYALGLLLLIIGMARPQSGKSETLLRSEGIAVELVLDVSGSMEALDFELNGERTNRLTAVKHVVKSFVAGSKELKLSGRHGDLVGVVAFGGFADSKVPLTLDHGAVLEIVDSLQIPKPIRDRRGQVINAQTLQEELATAIGDGLALGVERLRASEAKSKVMVLLTDGDNNAGVIDPEQAADIAKELGIKVYTIGVGKTGRAPMPMQDEFGQTVLVPQMFKIDEELLRKIADTTGGKYFNATNTEGLADVYAEIDKLEKSKVEETKFTEYTELYPWAVIPGLALVVIVGLLNATRMRALP